MLNRVLRKSREGEQRIQLGRARWCHHLFHQSGFDSDSGMAGDKGGAAIRGSLRPNPSRPPPSIPCLSSLVTLAPKQSGRSKIRK